MVGPGPRPCQGSYTPAGAEVAGPADRPYPGAGRRSIIVGMGRPTLQLSLATLLGLVACVAVNVWLFRVGVLAGIIGLNVSKHVLIAYLCKALGVGRPPRAPESGPGR